MALVPAESSQRPWNPFAWLWVVSQMSSIFFGDTMVPNMEQDYILLLGIIFNSYKEYYLTRSNHQKNTTQIEGRGVGFRV